MFKLESSFKPCGDQPQAIEKLSQGLRSNKRSQVLLGVTGSGKTFTMANVIAEAQKPTLVLAHNKTLAAQLYQEFCELFPHNAVEYFVSYYDYYQPEAYVARTDTYIEKDLSINDQIERLRLRATCSLLERKDVVIVSSVSCIYGLGMPEHFISMRILLEVGQVIGRDELLLKLIELQYSRNDIDRARAHFRVRGDSIEVVPAYEEDIGYRIELFGDDIERIVMIDPLTGEVKKKMETLTLYPASHHVTPKEVRERAMLSIQDELQARSQYFQSKNQLIEQQRINQRTRYDIEMIKEMGYCKGVENYSRYFSGRSEGDAPSCLLDYFPSDFLLFVDESHQTLPQIRAMYKGDRARKQSLIEFGFRLPSAYDNRPLMFDEFYQKIDQVVYVSATPSAWEVEDSKGDVIEQIIRPTGLLDPVIEVRPATRQVDDSLAEMRKETAQGGRVLVTTLTKKLSEDLSKYLQEIGVKAKYLHSDIDTLDRVKIIQDLRKGDFDVLVGINLLREGLDIPEVSLVVILDADKEGFLRSETALIQTCGRASRNVNGRVIMYADKNTGSMSRTQVVTQKRRVIQQEYNMKHGITPQSIKKALSKEFIPSRASSEVDQVLDETLTPTIICQRIKEYKTLMKTAAKERRFEEAAQYRDRMHAYQSMQLVEDFPQ